MKLCDQAHPSPGVDAGIKKKTYCVRPVLRPAEMGHTIEAREGSASTLVPMRVEFLLGEDIAACLAVERIVSLLSGESAVSLHGWRRYLRLTSHWNETMIVPVGCLSGQVALG